MYNSNSVREPGTLKFFREKYGRKNVTPTKVLDSYEGCEQFVLSVGTAYLLEGALEFWGIADLSATPTKNIIPPNLRNNKTPTQAFTPPAGLCRRKWAQDPVKRWYTSTSLVPIVSDKRRDT